jgi:hypothetical protein
MCSDYYVYAHKRKSNGQVFYIGKGTKRRAWEFNKRSNFWKNEANKHGVIVEVLIDGLQEWYALEIEEMLITNHGLRHQGGTLVNFQTKGYASSGDKISKRLIAKPKSIEHRQKLSLATKKYFANNPTAGFRTPHTAEAKSKISLSRRGKTTKENNPFAKKIICNETGQQFDALVLGAEWLRSLGFTKATAQGITNCLVGKYKKYHGFSWRYHTGV